MLFTIFPLMRHFSFFALLFSALLGLLLVACGDSKPNQPGSGDSSSSNSGDGARLTLVFSLDDSDPADALLRGSVTVARGTLKSVEVALDGKTLVSKKWTAEEERKDYELDDIPLDLTDPARFKCDSKHSAVLSVTAQDGTKKADTLAVDALPCRSSSSIALPSSDSKGWKFEAEEDVSIEVPGSEDLDGDGTDDLSVAWSGEVYEFDAAEGIQTVSGLSDVTEGESYPLVLDTPELPVEIGNKFYFLVKTSKGATFLVRNMTATKKNPMTVTVWNASKE
jgi:hypothetical protein